MPQQPRPCAPAALHALPGATLSLPPWPSQPLAHRHRTAAAAPPLRPPPAISNQCKPSGAQHAWTGPRTTRPGRYRRSATARLPPTLTLMLALERSSPAPDSECLSRADVREVDVLRTRRLAPSSVIETPVLPDSELRAILFRFQGTVPGGTTTWDLDRALAFCRSLTLSRSRIACSTRTAPASFASAPAPPLLLSDPTPPSPGPVVAAVGSEADDGSRSRKDAVPAAE